MQRMKTILFATVAALSLTLVAALPITVQADNGDTTLIHACVLNKDGSIRIVTPTTSCKNNEAPLHWVNVGRVTAIESKNTTQDSAISSAQSINTSQASAISALQAKDSSQDAVIAAAGGGTGGLVVKDSLGHEVGPLLQLNNVAVKLGNTFFTTAGQVFQSGFDNSCGATCVAFFHTSADCLGTRYISSDTQNLPSRSAASVNGTLYFPAAPFQQLTVNSIEVFTNSGDDVTQPGTCQSGPTYGFPFTETFGTVGTFDLSVFTPPFHVE